jgi:hypothetical protein
MKPAAGVCILLLLIGCVSPYLLPSLYLNVYGIVTGGRVTAKQERVEFHHDDAVRHALEVTYQYVPAGAQRPETSVHQVDPSTYDRLHIGSPVKVRYAPWPFLRSLHIVALGSVLADTTWASRLPRNLEEDRVYFDLSAIGLSALLGVIAWRTKNQLLIVAAAFCGGVVGTAIVPIGFVTLPVLFAAWRKSPGRGYGVALLAAMAVCIPVLYWRIPHNPPLPPGRSGSVQAIVRQIGTVDHVWSNRESSGEYIPQPFQMVDLEFTPQAAGEPVHALDRVDLASVSNLRIGTTVPISYSTHQPRFARIEGGTRTYRDKAVAYIAKVTFIGSAAIVGVLLPLLMLADRIFTRVGRRLKALGPESIAQRISALPTDHLRRKAFEKLSKLPATDSRRTELGELSRLSHDDLRRKLLEKFPQFSGDDDQRKAIEAFFRKRDSQK